MAFQTFENETKVTPFIEGFNNAAIISNLNRLCNQTYRLLPTREEEGNWIKPLETLYIELLGLSDLLQPQQSELLTLVSKIDGLRVGGEDIDFLLYRRTIFECCGLINKIKENL